MTEKHIQCEEEKCDRDATTQVNWPGQGYIAYCDEHAEKAHGIAASLGMGLGMGER